jgi:hypothetical protein
MTDSLDELIKDIFVLHSHRLYDIPLVERVLRELLGVIDSQREALQTCGSSFSYDGSCGAVYDDAMVNQALTLSAPLQGWKEWGV